MLVPVALILIRPFFSAVAWGRALRAANVIVHQ